MLYCTSGGLRKNSRRRTGNCTAFQSETFLLVGETPTSCFHILLLLLSFSSLLGAARNFAAKKARGKFLLFMDDDNYAKPYEISTFVRVVNHTGAQLLSSFVDYFSGLYAPTVLLFLPLCCSLTPLPRLTPQINMFKGPRSGTGTIVLVYR